MSKQLVRVAVLLLWCTSTYATVLLVPEQYPRGINWAIDAAVDGDTISVWGPAPGQPAEPPYVYYENVDFLGKRLFLVNRSFLPGEVPYDSSWEHVEGGGVR